MARWMGGSDRLTVPKSMTSPGPKYNPSSKRVAVERGQSTSAIAERLTVNHVHQDGQHGMAVAAVGANMNVPLQDDRELRTRSHQAQGHPHTELVSPSPCQSPYLN